MTQPPFVRRFTLPQIPLDAFTKWFKGIYNEEGASKVPTPRNTSPSNADSTDEVVSRVGQSRDGLAIENNVKESSREDQHCIVIGADQDVDMVRGEAEGNGNFPVASGCPSPGTIAVTSPGRWHVQKPTKKHRWGSSVGALLPQRRPKRSSRGGDEKEEEIDALRGAIEPTGDKTEVVPTSFSSPASATGRGRVTPGAASPRFPRPELHARTRSPVIPRKKFDKTVRAIASQEAKTLLLRRARLRAQVGRKGRKGIHLSGKYIFKPRVACGAVYVQYISSSSTHQFAVHRVVGRPSSCPVASPGL